MARITTIATGVAGLLSTAPATAHVKWFTEPASKPVSVEPDPVTLSLAGALLMVGLALAKLFDALVHHFALTPRRLYSHSTRPLRLVYYLIAVYFLGAAFTHTFLAPHIRVSEPWLYLGIGAQLLIYSGLLLDRGRGVCAALIVVLFVIAGWHDPLFVLEYPMLLGLAWIVLFADERPSPLGLLLVRGLLGVSLVSLAFTEKLQDPVRALSLLEQYSFNFMNELGLPYSDRLFVYSAGIVELLIGLVLLAGWVTRLTVLVLFGFMVATNAYVFALGETRMGWIEMIGHLPLFACGLLLLFYHRVSRALSLPAKQATAPATPDRLR